MDTFADDAFHAVFSVAQWEEGVGLCLAFLSPLEVEHRIDGMTSRAKLAAQYKGHAAH